jgi:hypothetical protein
LDAASGEACCSVRGRIGEPLAAALPVPSSSSLSTLALLRFPSLAFRSGSGHGSLRLAARHTRKVLYSPGAFGFSGLGVVSLAHAIKSTHATICLPVFAQTAFSLATHTSAGWHGISPGLWRVVKCAKVLAEWIAAAASFAAAFAADRRAWSCKGLAMARAAASASIGSSRALASAMLISAAL